MKILVVDDHVLSRDVLRCVIKELRDDATVLEAADGRQAQPLIEQHADLGLILLDLNPPGRDGFSLLAEWRERYPAVSIVVLSAQSDRASLMRALDLGALGFIPKHSRREVMLDALQLVLSGGMYIPTEILARAEPQPHRDDAKPISPVDLGLTGRQVEVLSLHDAGQEQQGDLPRARIG
jgi:DNA-binding NarL/FixJ family response regulator